MDYQCVVVYTVIDIAPPRVDQLELSDGCVTWIKNKIKGAVAIYFNSLKLTPNIGLLQGNLACTYYKQGLIDLAIETYRRAIELQPNFPDAYCNLANALKEKGLVREAEELYNAALDLCPAHVDTLNNLANVKREQGKFREAKKLYLKALDYVPSFAATHSNLASLLQQQGKLHDALRHYKHAIDIQPQFADAHSNMGNTLRELQDATGAMICFQNAININPTFADAHCNLASIYKDIGKITEAIKYYKNALQYKPDFADAYCNLTHCFLIICHWDDYNSRMENVVKIVQFQLQHEKFTSVHPHHSILYPLSNETRKEIARRHATLYTEKVALLNTIPLKHSRQREGRLKIGYVSSDFGNHPTSHLMQSIPGAHDLTKVEIFCYALNPDDGTTFRRNISKKAEHFIDLSKETCFVKAANIINDDGIHVLINMNGYTKGARNEIFAMKPSPIQVMWLGYPATSGGSYMDYIITDETSCPESSHLDFSEKMAFMPFTYFIGDHKQMFPHILNKYIVRIDRGDHTSEIAAVINASTDINIGKKLNIVQRREVVKYNDLEPIELDIGEIIIPNYVVDLTVNPEQKQVLVKGVTIYNGLSIPSFNKKMSSGEEVFNDIVFTSRKQYGLSDESVVFCNFNQLYKMDPQVVKMWIEILEKVPNSVLWLLGFPAAGEPNLRKFVKNTGFDSNRIIFSCVTSKEEHVRRGQLADVCLDTAICNGHTTAMDVLWAGTPVVTLPGDTLASKVAASQLNTLGCTELIAENRQQYVEIAVKLGLDEKYRKYIRAKVSRARLDSTLFDCKYYASKLEELFEQMWHRYKNGLSPVNIFANKSCHQKSKVISNEQVLSTTLPLPYQQTQC